MSHTEEPAAPRALFDQIAQALAAQHEGVAPAQMFGRPCIKTSNKVFAVFYVDAIALKLAVDTHRQALALAGAHRWKPHATRQPMQEWVQIPFAHAGDWRAYAEQALQYGEK